MASHVFKIEAGKFGLTLTDPLVDDACAADATSFEDFTCQITSGALNASPNVSDETVPATWCDPEQTLPMVGATSYELAIAYLQDPDIVDGLSRFLFENDTAQAWFFMGLAGNNPPKAVGKIRLVSGAIGGEGRVSLTAEATLPVDGKPIVCFGDATGSESVGGSFASGAVAGSPGTWTPVGSIPPANLAALQAGDPNTIVANPTTAWTAGQHVLLGDAAEANWDGTAWISGVVPGAPVPATGATAGTPGTWTPAGSAPPADVPALIAGTPNAVVASPTTAWTIGQSVEAADAAPAYWNGTAWVAGTAAVATRATSGK